MSALASRWQALAVPEPPVSAQIYEALDVDRDFAPEIALHHIIAVDHFTDLQDLGVGELVDALALGYVYLLANLSGIHRSDTVDIPQGNDDALVGWYVDTCNSSHATILLLGLGSRPARPVP